MLPGEGAQEAVANPEKPSGHFETARVLLWGEKALQEPGCEDSPGLGKWNPVGPLSAW